jgi:pimeloyl-ACP methyl ester carboxylesterase
VASQAHFARPEVQRELDALGLTRTDRPLTSREETAKFRIGFAARMLADVRNWRTLTGGRALSRREVNDLTVKTYPPGGWDYVAEFARRDYPVAVIAADRDFLDTGAPLLQAWARQVPRLELTILPSAGHLPWIDQPDAFRAAVRRHLGRPDEAAAPAER